MVSRKKKIRRNQTANVLFVVLVPSIWKYAYLYQLLLQDKRFNLRVTVAPWFKSNESGVKLQNDIESTEKKFREMGCNVIPSRDNCGNWMNPRNEFEPDIVFFSAPYSYTHKNFRIENFKKSLTCYVPYAFVVISEIHMHYRSGFYNRLWCYYVETEIHKKFRKEATSLPLLKTKVVGYPGMDRFEEINAKEQKSQPEKKTIIWAPHHTISNQGSGLNYATFDQYRDYFFEKASEFEGSIHIIFKPHPLLKHKLGIEHGEQWANAYYSRWESFKYGELAEGPYLDLFDRSDALIHDCASFLAEYLAEDKPCMYLTGGNDGEHSGFNEFGEIAFQQHYHGSNHTEVTAFIENVVVKGADEMREQRLGFKRTYLNVGPSASASENIYGDLSKIFNG